MRHLLCALAATAAMAVRAACGGSAATPTTGGQPSAFPVTITRTGGVAGFRDVLAVAGDGRVLVTQKGGKPRHCQLTARGGRCAEARLTGPSTTCGIRPAAS